MPKKQNLENKDDAGTILAATGGMAFMHFSYFKDSGR
jgi:hypothetical protein